MTAAPLRRGVAALLAVVSLTAAAAACSDEPGDAARPLTTDEAQRLAVMRFRNFDAGTRSVTATVTDGGTEHSISGWVDFTADLGYGLLEIGAGDTTLLAWTPTGVATHPATGGRAPLPPPGTDDDAVAWYGSDLTPEASRLHALLATILMAGSDRPDNPLLVQQTDARWLRVENLHGVEVDVLSGPTADVVYDPATSSGAGDGSDSPIRYWVDAEGLLHRMEVRLGGAGEWAAVDFAAADGVEFATAFVQAAGDG